MHRRAERGASVVLKGLNRRGKSEHALQRANEVAERIQKLEYIRGPIPELCSIPRCLLIGGFGGHGLGTRRLAIGLVFSSCSPSSADTRLGF